MFDRALVVRVGLGLLALFGLTTLAMGSFLHYTSADALLYALISTQDLTFFYWGQGRLANVVPVIASPVSDESWNYNVQIAMLAASFFGMIWLFASFHRSQSRAARNWNDDPVPLDVVAAVGASLITMFVVAGRNNYTFVLEQQYAFALLVFLVGLVGLMSTQLIRRAAGVPLVIVAILMIPSTVLFMPFAWVIGPNGRGHIQRFIVAGAVSVAGMVVSRASVSKFYNGPSQSEAYTDFSIGRAIDGLPTALENLRNAVRFPVAVVVLVACSLLLAAGWKQLGLRLQLAYLAAPLFAVGWILAFTGNRWVELNLFVTRYYFPVVAALAFVIAGALMQVLSFVVDRWQANSALSPRIGWALPVVVLGLVGLAGFGLNKLAAAPAIPVVEQAQPSVDAARELEVEFVVGSYWSLWPIVYSARDQGLDVYGTGYRSESTRGTAIEIAADHAAADEDIELLCADIDETTCAAQFSDYLGSPWKLRVVLARAPLVISVIPADA